MNQGLAKSAILLGLAAAVLSVSAAVAFRVIPRRGATRDPGLDTRERYPTSASTLSRKTRVCRSMSSPVVSGEISAML
jgi:hypothetical protein